MKTSLVMLTILALGGALRVYGIDFGLPFLYNVDEPDFVNRAFNLLSNKSLNPHWFGHPGTVTIYCLAVLFSVYSAVAVAVGHFADFAAVRAVVRLDPSEFYLAGRLMIAAFGLGVVYLTFELAKRISSREVGYFAALLVAIAPLSVDLSRLIRTDIQVTFFILLVLLCCLRIVERGQARDYIAAGLSLGIAVATKYPAVIGCLPVILAAMLATKNRDESARSSFVLLLIAGAASVTGAFLASPFLFIDIRTVLHDVAGEGRAEHLSATSEGFLSSLYWYVSEVLVANFTLAGLLLALIGATTLLRNRDRSGALLLLGFIVPFWLFVSTLNLRWERWFMPVIPVIAIFCASGFVWLLEYLRKFPDVIARSAQATVLLGLLGISSVLIHADYVHAAELARGDTRTEAGKWILANVSKDSVLLMERNTPQLPKDTYVILRPKAGRIEESPSVAVSRSRFHRVDGAIGSLRSVEEVRNSAAEYVVISNEYDRRLAEKERYAAELPIYEDLFEHARLVHVSTPVRGRMSGPIIRVFKLK